MNEAKKYLEGLSYEEYTLLFLSLTKYAVKKAKDKTWRTGKGGELPGGETDDSIPSKAFVKVLTGDRVWNPEKHPDFMKYMFDVIDSLLSHLATGNENKLFVNENDGKFSVNSEGKEVGVLAAAEEGFVSSDIKGQYKDAGWLVRNQLTPEEELIAGEEKVFNDEILRSINDLIEDDSELTAMVEAMSEGINKPADIAKHTNIGIEKIYNAGRRLDRVVARVRKQFEI